MIAAMAGAPGQTRPRAAPRFGDEIVKVADAEERMTAVCQDREPRPFSTRSVQQTNGAHRARGGAPQARG